jgi:hypothetical protein
MFHLDFSEVAPDNNFVFALDVSAISASIPIVDFTLSSFATNQGWVESQLEADLLQAFIAGSSGTGHYSVSSFALPDVGFDIPGNQIAVFENDLEVQANNVPEPPVFALWMIGFGVLLMKKLRGNLKG